MANSIEPGEKRRDDLEASEASLDRLVEEHREEAAIEDLELLGLVAGEHPPDDDLRHADPLRPTEHFQPDPHDQPASRDVL